MTATISTERLSWPRRLGWAVGDTGVNFYWQGVSIFAYFFYTDVMGIPPFWAGVAFGIASFWDAVTDPIMGAIADRTRTRYGRFRPWILGGSVPCAVTFALMYWTPPLTGGWLVAYAVATHMLLRTALTVVGIPFSALSARISRDANERVTLAALRVVFAATGALIVAFTIPKLVSIFGDKRDAYFWAAVMLGVGATIILVISFLSTHETLEGEEDNKAPPQGTVVQAVVRDIRDFWKTLQYNVPLRLMFIGIMLGGITAGMFGKVLLYWITYDLKQPAAMAWMLPLPALVLLPVAPIWIWVATKTSKRTATWIGSAISAVATLLFYFLNPHDTPVLAALLVLGAIGGTAHAIMFWAMLPDTVEYNEWVRGERSEAKIFGFATFAQKTAIGINALMLGQLLTQVGFVANQPQSVETLSALRDIMCLVPLAGGIASALVLVYYPINASYHAKLRADIAARHAQRAAEGASAA